MVGCGPCWTVQLCKRVHKELLDLSTIKGNLSDYRITIRIFVLIVVLVSANFQNCKIIEF